MNKLKSKGIGPWKYEWYSVCSAHIYLKDSCAQCQVGTWINCYKQSISSYIFDKNPNLWCWHANQPNRPGLLVLIFHYLYEKILGIKIYRL